MAARGRLKDFVPGVLGLLAVTAMAIAMFVPFVTIPIYGGLISGGGAAPREAGNLISSSDARWIVVTLILLAGTVVAQLIGWRRRAYAVVSLVASVAALALAFIEAQSNGWRVLPGLYGAGAPGTPTDLGPVDNALGIGYLLFLAGAILAVIAAVTMLALAFRGRSLRGGGLALGVSN